MVPNIFGTRDQFCGRGFPWMRGGWGVIQEHYICWTFYHLRSLGIRSQRSWGTPEVNSHCLTSLRAPWMLSLNIHDWFFHLRWESIVYPKAKAPNGMKQEGQIISQMCVEYWADKGDKKRKNLYKHKVKSEKIEQTNDLTSILSSTFLKTLFSFLFFPPILILIFLSEFLRLLDKR